MRKILIVAVLSFIVLLGSCKMQKSSAPAPDADALTTIDGTVDIVTDHKDVTQMLDQTNAFSLGFFKNLSKSEPHTNISFSPASLNLVMGVVYSGARAQTQSEMSQVFGFDPSHDQFHALYNAYYTELMNLSRDTLVEFSLANRVFFEQTYPVADSYIDDVQKWLGGAFEKIDFIQNPSRAESTINTWVEEITRQRIRNLVPPGALNELTRMVLVNALYIKSSWKYPFNEENTTAKDFTSSEGKTVSTQFMIQRRSRIPYYEEEDFIAMELPYTTPELSLILIRPNAERVTNIADFVPNTDMYARILDGLRPHLVEMEIPTFTIESEFSLTQELKNAGMEKAFTQQADFRGMSDLDDLSVSDVFQKVFFELDEKGSEAAAATAVVMVTTSMPVEPPQPRMFIADRPFLFILKENRFHTPLFVGQYVK